jgi:oxygen-independent coproporphyrinogen-3 oxidase
LQAEFGPRAATLTPILEGIADKFGALVTWGDQQLDILPQGRSLTRMVAAAFDQHVPDRMTYSRAS